MRELPFHYAATADDIPAHRERPERDGRIAVMASSRPTEKPHQRRKQNKQQPKRPPWSRSFAGRSPNATARSLTSGDARPRLRTPAR